MITRQEHQQEVHAFLKKHLSIYDWKFSLPHGSGMETYLAHGFKRSYFVKVGVQVDRYLTMADLGLTPPVILHGQLESGVSVIVQLLADGRKPSRLDYRERLTEVAELVNTMHHHPRIIDGLSPAPSNLYQEAGLRAWEHLYLRWENYKGLVPATAEFVDESLEAINRQIRYFSGDGLVASHGDICNANWLFASDGRIYIVDLDSMSMDDPAADMGALLWWYYPPELREQFLRIPGYPYDEEFKFRMQVRMAMHCLSILLPRANSFDQFDPESFAGSLEDFKAALNGEENPQGYD